MSKQLPFTNRRKTAEMTTSGPKNIHPWSPDSWKSRKALQIPEYDDENEVDVALDRLRKCSPLVFAGEVRSLRKELERACNGEAFVLMGGDCAETFQEFHVDKIRDTFRVLLQMALVITFGASLPVIKIGRMAGQFAKPRSSPTETKNGITLPSFRGDIVNRSDFSPESRKNKPENMVEAYHQSSQTLNILRAFSTGGYASIERLHEWNLEFVNETEEGSRYRKLATRVDESLRFMKAIGIDINSPTFTQIDFYTAHEALLLPYEEALTRIDSTTGDFVDCSAHMLWVGERTRQVEGAHIEFARGIPNPIGLKVSSKCTQEDLIRTCEALNPNNIPGKLTLIVRMGADALHARLPGLIRAVQDAEKHVVWVSDPVHGNTRNAENENGSFKTRDFSAIRAELEAFFDIHDEMGTHPGGIHLEMTGERVTECVGGSVHEIMEENLHQEYRTHCDPRLNAEQSLELAFLVAERMRARAGLPPLE